MSSTDYNNIPQENVDVHIIRKKKIKPKNKDKQNKSNFFAYLYLFSFVFLAALYGLSVFIKSYSPSVDVAIGNNDTFTLNDSDVDMEIKTVDERLKWIQMEDDLPTVSIRSSDKEKKSDKDDIDAPKKKKDEKTSKAPVPTLSEIKKQHEDFKNIPPKEVIPQPKHAITKVYLGNYSTIEQATDIQNQVVALNLGITPFVKSVNGHYVVQLGSFTDGDKAGVLSQKLRLKGFYPKVNYETEKNDL